MFNVLDASGGIGVTERTAYILRVRQLAVAIAKAWAGVEAPRSAGAMTAGHDGSREHKHEARTSAFRASRRKRRRAAASIEAHGS